MAREQRRAKGGKRRAVIAAWSAERKARPDTPYLPSGRRNLDHYRRFTGFDEDDYRLRLWCCRSFEDVDLRLLYVVLRRAGGEMAYGDVGATLNGATVPVPQRGLERAKASLGVETVFCSGAVSWPLAAAKRRA